MRIRRAMLFMPGDDRRKVEKGAALNVDSVILDLEDGVALSNKVSARGAVLSALREVQFGRSERVVRTNAPTSDLWEDDIRATIDGKPDAYLVPKIESARQVQQISALLSHEERARGWDEGAIPLLIMIETALGVVNLREIAASDPRLAALVFGGEDLAGSLGATRTPEGWEIFYGRSAVVTHAKAFGLQAIDGIFTDFTEDALPRLLVDTEQALMMGFDGKTAIHPRHIEPIQQVFTPTAEQIAAAQRVVDAHHQHQRSGAGAFALDGKMVDMPVVRQAEQVIARAKAAGVK
jgi:citrate lyase beta subunit